MSDKVKLPKADFEALENSKSLGGFWKQKVLQLYLDHKLSFEVGFETLLQALVNGYEVEQTPEDKVREYYENFKAECGEAKTSESFDYFSNKMYTIRTVLDLLNFKIEGVNA